MISEKDLAPIEPITFYSKPSREEEAAAAPTPPHTRKTKIPPELQPLVQKPYEFDEDEEDGEALSNEVINAALGVAANALRSRMPKTPRAISGRRIRIGT